MAKLVISDKEADLVEEPLDAFHKHQVLHTSSIINEMFDNHICETRFIQEDPKLLEAAEALSEKLAEFYQLVGNSEVGEDTLLMPDKLSDEMLDAMVKNGPIEDDGLYEKLGEMYEGAVEAVRSGTRL